ncbi:MAG: tryptophan synthase subunit beta [Gammaproteobacteria bacterium]|uniref:tryptophan synthase subunit beta n=1 Tax=Rhodoferax sp. TaxID=50421 RepID=UPI0017D181F7|nr:tryptophan synthase subunit beta [Rhodoferax sp.]MBU3899978.1 tryptophan synthase subunit beta [Gammaproteobacteria bacterium]MBA3056358.1 tryptophan synthase subunit beta [Rhodoferax sp.]MBU3996382.1 tryptophan synthase subunit beta [Gammaproteobacteria bacterium]MBU4019244.1 tryptophan synthase subunit beta [Gammaproteobacteria bacterium]MBU4078962.1 tryptophan synthase subunit beta [Gammaproteobacteria bacterium]
MYQYQQPDPRGHFGIFGGSFVSETLTHAINELKAAYAKYQFDPAFVAEFEYELKHFVGRPSPVYHAARMSREQGGAQIFLKREDLNHTGAHKINNTIGQAMLAQRMGKPRVIAETGAGQHGVATATICARYGLECVVYMGSEDVKRQSPNVYRMNLLGATVVPVESGSRTLKDALNEAMRDWVANVDNTFYIIGTVAGPHPYPMMVRDFQSVIGKECLVQMPEMLQAAGCTNAQPDVVTACVGGGSNAMGIFHPYIAHGATRLIGVEAAGEGMDSGKHSASLQRGSPGVLHGNRTYVLQDDNGQVTETHSISAGLDYPGVGPEHAFLKDIGRAEYVGITDSEALAAFHYLCRTEGIIPALESSHALAYAMKLAKTMRPDQSILVNLSGRGDKDIGTVADLSNADFFCRPSCTGQSVKGNSLKKQPASLVQTAQAAIFSGASQ